MGTGSGGGSGQRRLDAALSRLSETMPVAAGMTAAPGTPACGVAQRHGHHVVVHAGWLADQDDRMLLATLRREVRDLAYDAAIRPNQTTVH